MFLNKKLWQTAYSRQFSYVGATLNRSWPDNEGEERERRKERRRDEKEKERKRKRRKRERGREKEEKIKRKKRGERKGGRERERERERGAMFSKKNLCWLRQIAKGRQFYYVEATLNSDPTERGKKEKGRTREGGKRKRKIKRGREEEKKKKKSKRERGREKQEEKHCNTLQHTATTHCNTMQHTAAHCNTLQHAIMETSTWKLQYENFKPLLLCVYSIPQSYSVRKCCNVSQRAAACCSRVL